MGCEGSKNIQYQHGVEKRAISRDVVNTLDRWSLGAYARIRVMKMKRDFMI